MNPERDRWRAAMHMNNAAINITDTGNIDYSIFSSQHIRERSSGLLMKKTGGCLKTKPHCHSRVFLAGIHAENRQYQMGPRQKHSCPLSANQLHSQQAGGDDSFRDRLVILTASYLRL
ncbi:MAG: hypothetical protein IPG99_01625 [Ignavibacteria bacterium]|nr:hypothetical protein [Ignavibacteria bacterium]